jgi:hypothetical protein
MEQRVELKNLTAKEYLLNIQQNRLMAIHTLNKVVYRTIVPPLAWNVGQPVWLKGKNLPLPYGTIKLAP